MRGAIGRRIRNPSAYNLAKQTPFLIQSSSPFSSSSGSGRGRGRGGGYPSDSVHFDFTRTLGEAADSDEPKHDTESPPVGLGHGRGRPISSDPLLPSFSAFISSTRSPSSGAGRGRVATESSPSRPASESRPSSPPSQPQPPAPPRMPIFVKKEDIEAATETNQSSESTLPSSILSVLSGAGRGKPMKEPAPTQESKEQNRHLRRMQQPTGRAEAGKAGPAQPKLSREEAVKKAVSILSRGGGDGQVEGGGRGGRGRGMRGRGGRGRGRFSGEDRRRVTDSEEGHAAGFYLGDNADGEKLAKRVGPEFMNKLNEGFEELSDRVLPSPLDDAYLDAMHTNFLIEFEPEYLMEEFGTNPDIDEKPPIPLRDALEKMKPFLMAYEGIQSQEEWEEAIDQVMERVPLLKEIVDHYSGPDRVTAKQQQEELDRVAKTIPESAPASVQRFANRAVLSLQSNPGWGFDKKCQFMDKVVWEVSQHYK